MAVIDPVDLIVRQIAPAVWAGFSSLGPLALAAAVGPLVLKRGWALFTSAIDRTMDAGAITGASQSSKEYNSTRAREDRALAAMRDRLERQARRGK